MTALTAAAARAAHLIVDDEPHIFADTLAYPLLGDRAEEFVSYHRQHGGHAVLAGARAAATTRSRFTEDRLAEALPRGITQYVILGAGLDSFAYRSALAGRVRTFEVDHPATQAWKRRTLVEAGLAVPETVAFVPVDFEADPLAGCLAEHGFDPAGPALVSWLGVTMYLTRDSIARTVAQLGGFAAGTRIVIDYLLPPELRDDAGRAYAQAVAPVAAERGEPWLSCFAPDELTGLLAGYGFGDIEHVSQYGAVAPGLWDRSDPLRPSGLSCLAYAVRRG